MHLKVIFKNKESRLKAVHMLKSAPTTEDNIAVVPWDMLTSAKLDPNTVSFEQISDEPEEFIIKGDINNPQVAELITDVKDLGEGFYHVKSSHGLALHGLVQSLDPVHIHSFGRQVVARVNAEVKGEVITDFTAPAAQWGRIRIVSTYRPLLTTFEYYDTVVAKSKPELYIFDSGVNWNHQEFEVVEHDDFWKSDSFADFSDKVGHGTAMASVAAGKNIGIARDVKLRSIKISEDESIPFSLIDLNDAIGAILRECYNNPFVTRVVNCSWTVPKNTFLESRFQALLNAGVTVVAAAGNTGADIATISPAGMTTVLTVASIDKFDIPSGFNNIAPSDTGLTTNYGNMLDIFAPGELVACATKNNNNEYVISNGTSISAAYVSGVLAQTAALFEGQVPNPILMQKILDTATTDAILFDTFNFNESQNKIVHLSLAKDIAANSLDLYMGAFHPQLQPNAGNVGKDIILDVNSIIDLSKQKILDPDDKFTWSVSFENNTDGNNYGPFITIDPYGFLTVKEPQIKLPPDEIIHMVMFKVYAKNNKITLETPWLFFYQVADTLSAEEAEQNITRALSATNSTSCFGSMFATLK
jgi:hypothetical protein